MEGFLLIIGLLILVTFLMPWINHWRIRSLWRENEYLTKRLKNLEANAVEQPIVKHETPKDSQTQGTVNTITPDDNAVNKAHADVKESIAEDRAQWEDITVISENQQQEAAKDTASEKPAVIDNAAKKQAKSEASYALPLTAASKKISDTKKVVKTSVEMNLASKLPVWIGAISLIFAAFYLVKYSIEYGLLTPEVRLTLGGLFAASLVGAGHFIGLRPRIANYERLAQGLIGAGVVGLFVALYGAVNLHHLLSPVIGFGGMTIVTIMAVMLSLKHGQPIAVFGIIGGALTPALVASDAPNTIVLFSYLFVLFCGVCVVMLHQKWWGLGCFALLSVYVWTLLWLLLGFNANESIIVVSFLLGTVGAVLASTTYFITHNEDTLTNNKSLNILNGVAVAGAVGGMLLLSQLMHFDLFDWAVMTLFSAALMFLSCFNSAFYRVPLLVKLAIDMILLFAWAQNMPAADALAVIAMQSVVYIGGATYMLKLGRNIQLWASVQMASVLAIFVTSSKSLVLPAGFIKDGPLFWGVMALFICALSILQVSRVRSGDFANEDRPYLLAVYAFAASAFLTLSAYFIVPWYYMSLVIAGQVLATVWIYTRTQIPFLKTITSILIVAFALLNIDQCALFAEMLVNSLVGDAVPSRVANAYELSNPFLKLGVPTILFFAAGSILAAFKKDERTLLHALYGVAHVVLIFFAYYAVRMAFAQGDGLLFTQKVGFIERGYITSMMLMGGIIAGEVFKRLDVTYLSFWSKALVRGAILRILYFDMIFLNPLWSPSQYVGNVPLLNGVTLTYGMGIIAGIWMLSNRDIVARSMGAVNMISAFAFTSLLALITLNVRQYFHGGILEYGAVSNAEQYSYSAIWLLTGFAILALGIHKGIKSIRMAALGFIGLTVCKVFLIDAGDLEGLWRVGAFLGLGLSLMGLSFFYTRFVSVEEQKAETE